MAIKHDPEHSRPYCVWELGPTAKAASTEVLTSTEVLLCFADDIEI